MAEPTIHMYKAPLHPSYQDGTTRCGQTGGESRVVYDPERVTCKRCRDSLQREPAGHRLPSKAVKSLQDAIESAQLIRSSFDCFPPYDGMTVTVRKPWSDGEMKDEVHEGTVTDFIREKVRLHHGSWIIHPMEAVLEWSLSTDDGSMKEYDIVGRLSSKLPNPAVIAEAKKQVERLQLQVGALEHFKRKVLGGVEDLKKTLDAIEKKEP